MIMATNPTPAQITGWDYRRAWRRWGWGLPPGKGTVQRGFRGLRRAMRRPAMVSSAKVEGRFPKLVGGAGTLMDDRPELTVGSYWPFAPTLWELH